VGLIKKNKKGKIQHKNIKQKMKQLAYSTCFFYLVTFQIGSKV